MTGWSLLLITALRPAYIRVRAAQWHGFCHSLLSTVLLEPKKRKVCHNLLIVMLFQTFFLLWNTKGKTQALKSKQNHYKSPRKMIFQAIWLFTNTQTFLLLLSGNIHNQWNVNQWLYFENQITKRIILLLWSFIHAFLMQSYCIASGVTFYSSLKRETLWMKLTWQQLCLYQYPNKIA